MRVLRKQPGKPWEAIEVANELEALQAEVGGYIETVKMATDAVIICNEEGRLRGLPPSGFFDFVGTLLLVGIAGDEFTDVPDAACECFGVKEATEE